MSLYGDLALLFCDLNKDGQIRGEEQERLMYLERLNSEGGPEIDSASAEDLDAASNLGLAKLIDVNRKRQEVARERLADIFGVT